MEFMRMMKKRQLAKFALDNMKMPKNGNHSRDDFDWYKHCRNSFPTPAAFIRFYKLTKTRFDSLRDKKK